MTKIHTQDNYNNTHKRTITIHTRQLQQYTQETYNTHKKLQQYTQDNYNNTHKATTKYTQDN